MNYLKPCRNCGSLERYPNGACKPCALEKQRVRNEEIRLDEHRLLAERHKENKKRKEQAKSKGQVHYESLTPCHYCGELIRYVSNGTCIGCIKSRKEE